VAKQSAQWRQWRPESLEYRLMSHRREIAVIGLGGVGLPVAAVLTRVLDRGFQLAVAALRADPEK
jgi:hypothetical protein